MQFAPRCVIKKKKKKLSSFTFLSFHSKYKVEPDPDKLNLANTLKNKRKKQQFVNSWNVTAILGDGDCQRHGAFNGSLVFRLDPNNVRWSRQNSSSSTHILLTNTHSNTNKSAPTPPTIYFNSMNIHLTTSHQRNFIAALYLGEAAALSSRIKLKKTT